MKEHCAIILCVFLGVALAAPSVFQRNGLQREQESALRREPFDPLSPFHQISPSNVQTGSTLVVPPTINVDTTYTKAAASEGPGPSRTFLNHFEILNRDALVGLLIEKDIPFYVKTIVEPQKPPLTRIHVMRIPKKHESTSPLPNVNLNLVELVNNDNITLEKGSYNTGLLQNGKPSQKEEGGILKVELRNEDFVRVSEASAEQEPPLLSVTDTQSGKDELPQGDDPNAGTTTPVYQHAVIYTPEKRPDHKSLWESIGDAYDKAKDNIGDAYDKAKDKTKELAGKAKEKIDPLIEKAREKAKDVLDSDESSKEKKVVKPEDDI